MTRLLRLDPPLPLKVRRGKTWVYAMAHVLLDYGVDYDLCWVCFLHDSGECWTVGNKDVRAVDNETMGRRVSNGKSNENVRRPEENRGP